MPPAALTSTLSPAELCPDVPSPAYLLFLQTQLTLPTSFLLKGSFPGSDGFSQYLHPPLGLGILLTVTPLLPKTSLKVHQSAAMPTQLSLDVSYPLLTRLLSPTEICLGSKYPCDLAPLYSLSHLQSPSPSAHTRLSAKLWFTPTHFQPSLGKHGFPVSLVFLTSCLHSIPCTPCVCACVLCGAGRPLWACMGASPAQTRGTRSENSDCGRHGPGQGRAETIWLQRPPRGTVSGQLMAQLSAQLPKPSGSSTPVRD